MRAICCTIVTRNYLAQARTLMQSVAENFPDAKRHVLIVDGTSVDLNLFPESFSVSLGEELGVAGFRSLAFVNDPVGFCCLLKPRFVSELFSRTSADTIFYLDSDLVCYGPPIEALAQLQQTPVIITPHALTPLDKSAVRKDADIVKSGVFNAGFFGVQRSAESQTFLAWWFQSMIDQWRLLRTQGHDQPFLSLAVVYFPWIGIFREEGYNVAYWNLIERPLYLDQAGTFWAGKSLLRFFHFSFFDPTETAMLINRPPIVVPAKSVALQALMEDYVRRLQSFSSEVEKNTPYRFGVFSDGKPIRESQRAYYAERVHTEAAINADPFDPHFETAHYRGLKSVYASSDGLPRSIRGVRRWMRLLRADPNA